MLCPQTQNILLGNGSPDFNLHKACKPIDALKFSVRHLPAMIVTSQALLKIS